MTMGRCMYVLCDSMLGSPHRGVFYRSASDRTVNLEVLLCPTHENQIRRDRETRMPWSVTDEGWVYPMVLMDALGSYGRPPSG